MKTLFVFPGSFCPPTYGHVEIVKQAAAIFPELIVVCSRNPQKQDNLFSMQECKDLWLSYYLPENVKVLTFDEFSAEHSEPSCMVMVRGVRCETDFEEEKTVMFFNNKTFKISKFFYVLTNEKYINVSSSKSRKLAQELKLNELKEIVSPGVVAKLLEKTLNLKNLFLVVGKPASGKSTFLKMMSDLDSINIHINTDDFNEKLKPLVAEHFKNNDLVSCAVNKTQEIKELLKAPWLKMLTDELKKAAAASNVFVEVPYGLMPEYHTYDYLTSKVIYVGCDESENIDRIENRKTPEYKPFLSRIPGKEETEAICLENKLDLICIDSRGFKESLWEQAANLNKQLRGD